MDSIKAFRSPPREFSACAFWFWNGTLSPARMMEQMDDMRDKGVFNAFMHARAFLKTAYLSEDWFRVMDACVNRARDTGFFAWLYDEYAWPSGTCGSTFDHGLQAPSRVLSKGQQNMAKGLDVNIISGTPDPTRRLIASYSLTDGRTMVFYEHVYEKAVDYLNPDTIRDFLSCTHELYKQHYGDDFGKTIPGIFFDEIYLAAQTLPWTDRLPEAFVRRYGYDLMAKLPALVQGDDANARQIRADYYALLAALYKDAFFKQIGDWCTQNGLQLTGHTEEDVLHHPRRQGNYFLAMQHLHIPGADCHDYRYRFPREISMHEPKYAVSVARLYGKPRAMSEAMGGAGWGCTLQAYKRGINALGAAGINQFILHGFYNDCEHQGSQGDWPASFFFQNPYWKYFKQFAVYIHRISYMNTLGKAVVDVGLYYPIEEMAAHTLAGAPNAQAQEMDRQFHAVLRSFLETQIDIDMIDHESLLRAEVTDGCLRVGAQAFKLLIFPSTLRRMDAIADILAQFRAQGGIVLFYPVDSSKLPATIPPEELCTPDAMPARYRQHFQPALDIVDGRRDHLYCSCRIIDGQYAYMLASTLPSPRTLHLTLRGDAAVCKLQPEDGTKTPLASTQNGERLSVTLALEPEEACWLLTGCEAAALPPVQALTDTIALDGDWLFLPLGKPYDTKWAIDAKETTLSVPLARISDTQTGRSSTIRIRNMADKPGRCGRHISLWKASWLGRRIGWGDDADKHDLYFLKSLTLDAAVLSARICIAAVTRFTLYINGQTAMRCDSALTPQTLDIASLLHKGHNLIAVYVHTDSPLQSRELTQAEVIPPDALASLLLQGEIETEVGTIALLSDASWAVAASVAPDWTLQQPHMVQTIDPKQVLCHVTPRLTDTDWVWAWERGKPPMLPWGDLPLFGKLPTYQHALRYTVNLPAGATRVDAPEVLGEYSAMLDDQLVDFADGYSTLPADGQTHQLQLDVLAPSPDGGLLNNIRVHLTPQAISLGDFRLRGLAWFSGRALYQKTFTLQKDPARNYTLDLGRVCFYAEVWVNGCLCGTRLWEPYRVEITEQLQDGLNEIAIVVANSAACERRHMLVDEGVALAWNRYWNEDNIDREPDALISGLLGPVQILVTQPERSA